MKTDNAKAIGVNLEMLRLIAVLLVTADASVVCGLFATCQLIGWMTVLRAGVMMLNVFSAIAGLLTLGIGIMLHVDEVLATALDIGMCVVGGVVLALSLLGYLAAKYESLLHLRWYSGLQSMCALMLFATCMFLFMYGLDEVGIWLTELGVQLADQDPTVANMEIILRVLQEHRLASAALTVLMLFLFTMNLSMSVGLTYALRQSHEQLNLFVYDTIQNGAYER